MGRTTIDLATEADTAALAIRLAQHCTGSETILLSGPVGAGKSALARAIIRDLTSPDEEVPSPTFTLVQTYEAPRFDIWHVDLYRLDNLVEVDELGLFDAFGRALCLIEWADRLGDAAPEDALTVELSMKAPGEGRRAELTSSSPHWSGLFERADAG